MSIYSRAESYANSFSNKQTDPQGWKNVFRQAFAKLLVGGRTIGGKTENGKKILYVVGKPEYQKGRKGKLV